jgi:hypothetical protein
LPDPVVLLSNALAPIAIFLIPLELLYNDLYPNAILPDAVVLKYDD